MDIVKQRIEESISVKNKILESPDIMNSIYKCADEIIKTYKNNGKILLCGNGGSASDALHIAGELNGRFQMERKALPAIALNADIATMTAVSNDYGYEYVYSRQVESFMQKNDILICFSTSGRSKNIIRAVEKARDIGGISISLLGCEGGLIKGLTDISIIVPNQVAARIQEAHIMIGHILCELVECEVCK